MTRSIGKVTTASATGAGVGAALAAILVWALNLAGVDAAAIEAAISVVLTAGIALLGGYLVPPTEVDVPIEVQIDTDAVIEKINADPGKYVDLDDTPGKHTPEPDAFDDVIRPRD